MINRRNFNGLMLAGVAAGLVPGMALASGTSLDRVKASGKLRIGGIPDGAPYYQKSLTDGSWRGFYIDICKKLAEDLGVELDILETTWGNSVLDLQANKVDVFFGLNPTPERQKVIDFSGPVFKNSFSLVVKDGVEGAEWADFDRDTMRIAVDAGSSHDAAVGRHTPKAQISRLKTQSDATAALQAGRVDAQCLVLILALTLKAKNARIGNVVIPGPVDFTTSNAGFRREDDNSWREFVDGWITEHRDNGFIRQAIITNMELVGVTEADFPPGFDI